MDTKSRNFNSLKLKKTIAVILAAVLFFTSGLFICFLVKSVFYYNIYETGNTYTDTNVFYNVFSRFEASAIDNGEILSCENLDDYLKTASGKAVAKRAEEKAERISEVCDFLDEQKVKVSVTEDNRYRYSWVNSRGRTYYFSYDGGMMSAEEFDSYDYSGEGFTTLLDEEYFDEEYSDRYSEEEYEPEYETEEDGSGIERTTGMYIAESTETRSDNFIADETSVSRALGEIWNLTNGLNYGEKTKEELVKEVKKIDFEADNHYNNFYHNGYADEDSSLKFAIFYNTTGKVASNCGVKSGDSEKTILKKLGNRFFYEYYENGKFHPGASNSGEITSEYFYRLEKLTKFGIGAGEILKEKDNIDRAYFAFSPVLGSQEIMSLSKNAYDSYCRHSSIFGSLQNGRPAFYIAVAVITLIAALCCCAYLIVKAGKTDDGEVKLLFTDKIPFIIKAGISSLILFGLGAVIAVISYMEFYPVEIYGIGTYIASLLTSITNEVTALAFMLFMMILLGLVMSIIRTVRAHKFFRYTFFSLFVIIIKKFFGFIRHRFHKRAEKMKKIYAEDYAYGNSRKFLIISISVILAVALILFLLGVAACVNQSGVPLFFITLVLLAAVAYMILLVLCFDRICSGVSRIKLGSLTCNISKRFMPGFMRSLAEDIASIREGLQSAVNQAVKDQAMKAELITNVTHDLKTPLTSIITYVDLLKREGPDGEHAGEYIDVIDEKSQRLKKLVDDLVQASKASSGAIKLAPEKFDLCEFASQAVGEYADELKGAGVELILKNGSEPIIVYADPDLTGRIFENLVSNIKKYAMSGTRAYLEITKTDGYGTAVFKNISDSPLNYDTDRLTERFYRGDGARSGEGSGLGLSITEDLCKLQSGIFSVSADGDLFKAIVSLPISN